QSCEHELHLRLGGGAISDDGLFYLRRRVFHDRDAGLLAGEKNDAPGMAEYDGRANVVRVEHVFDGQRIRAMRADELADAVIYLLQTHRERLARSGADDTTLDE